MSELLADHDAPSDAELISAVRTGDADAYGQLFARHRASAEKMARQLVRGNDVDDLVSESFAKVLAQLSNGAGPDVAFRAYLLTAIRRLHVDRLRAAAHVQPTGEVERLDTPVEFHDPSLEQFEHSATAAAFASLPERWQLVLWHLDVEGAKPAEIAPLLSMSANSVSALAYRAREGLRQAYLQHHLADTGDDGCRWTTEHLGAYVRGGLAKRDRAKVLDHLEECRRCTGVYLELAEVNSNLAGVLAPALLGGAATGYLAAGGGKATLLGLPWLGAFFGRIRDWVTGSTTQLAIVAAGVVGVTVAGTLVFAVNNDDTSSRPATESPSAGADPSGPGPSAPGSNGPDSNAAQPARPNRPKYRDTSPSNSQPQAAPPLAPPGPLGGDEPAPTEPQAAADQPSLGPPQDASDDEPSGAPKRPGKPTALSATIADDKVTLRWRAPVGANVEGYEIYRRTKAGARTAPAVYEPRASMLVTATLAPTARTPGPRPISGTKPIGRRTYTDRDVTPGRTYVYRVKAVATNGKRSKAATERVTLPAPDDKPSPTPTSPTTPPPATPSPAADPLTGKLRSEMDGGWCIGLRGKSELRTVKCESKDAVVWELPSDETIRVDDQCITHSEVGVSSSPDLRVVKVALEACEGLPEQRWTRDPDNSGQFVVRSLDETNMVLDIAGGKAYTGCPVILYTRHGRTNQLFTLG